MNVSIGGIARTVEITSFDKLGDVKICMLTTTADGSVGFQQLNQEVIDAIDSKAVPDGNYEDMVVGSAEQLLSTQYDTDSVPYAFRKSPYGDREFDEIHGGTIAWNQQIYSTTSIVVPTSSTAVYEVTDSSHKVNLVSGHKYLILYEQATTLTSNTRNTLQYYNGSSYVSQSVSTNRNLASGIYSWLFTPSVTTSSGAVYIWCHSPSAQTTYKNFQFFDLTQMFGSAVADYIYGLGDVNGVAFFRAMFPKSYYAYNAGELISVSGLSAHKMTGFNQWDEVAEIGNILSSTGQNGTATNVLRTKNYIPIFPKTSYYNKVVNWSETNLKTRFYDADKNYIGYNDYNNATVQINSVFTTPKNAYFMRFEFSSGYGTTYNHDICINISWDGERNGQYEPYESHSYSLDDSLTLRGVPKLVDNKVQFDGDIYSSDGTVTRKYGIVDLGGLSWEAWPGYSGVYRVALPVDCKTMPNNNTVPNWLSAKYKVVQGVDIATNNNTIGQLHQTYLVAHDDAYNTANAFITAMSGVYLVYELATPTTESASPYVSPQICNEYGTEEYISAEQSGVTMIVGHNTKYPQNLRKKIEGLPWNFSNLIAPTEVTNKATRNYTVGSFLIMNNTLYKVTSAIANGGTITVGSNVTATTIMQEILAL